jgi:DNA-binding transcriptional LysR family regulator
MVRNDRDTRQPKLKALRSFHAIVRTGSVTAAAREMGLSQPTVSRILTQLESQVGFELFYRDRGRLVVTADGLTLFDEVDLALGQMDRLAGLIEDIGAYRTGELKLVAPPSFAEGVLPDIASAFLSEHPKVRLSIDSRSVETAKQLVASRAVDAGFLKLPIDRPELRAERIVASRTAAVLANDHPLASETTLSPAMLRGEPLILLGRGRESRHQIESAFRAAGVVPTVRVETHTIGSACALAARGLGVALVNERLARASLQIRSAVLLPFTPQIVQDYAFVTSAATGPSRLAAAFLEHARRYFAASGQEPSGPPVMVEPVAEPL